MNNLTNGCPAGHFLERLVRDHRILQGPDRRAGQVISRDEHRALENIFEELGELRLLIRRTARPTSEPPGTMPVDERTRRKG